MPLTPLPHGITFTEVGYTAPGGGVDPQPIVLGPLTLSAASVPADAEAGTIIGLIQGKTGGSSLSITPNDGRVALAGDDAGGWRLVVGLTAVSEGELLVTIRETHPDAEGPSDNLFALSITHSSGAALTGPLMFGVTRVRNNSGSLVVAASGTERKLSVFNYGLPAYRTNGYRIHYSGFALTEGGNSPQETVVPGNDTVIEGVWAIVGASIVNGAISGGTRHRLTFAGQNSVTIGSGATGSWTDEITFPANLAEEGNLIIATLYSTAVGQNQIPNARIQKHRGERIFGASDGATLIAQLDNLAAASTSALDVSYGTQSQPQFYGPDMIVQRAAEARNDVVLAVVDSIGESRQEFSVSSDARGNLGWLRRWLDQDDPTQGRRPHYIMGVPGSSSARELNTSATKRWDALDEVASFNGGILPFSIVCDQLAQNDLQTTFDPTMKNVYNGFLDRFAARYPGQSVIATGVLPRASSTDFYATRANQTPATGNVYPTGNKWLLEDWKVAGAGGRLAGYISTNHYWYDATYPGTWPPAPTTTLAAAVGTDGVATYNQIVVADAPELGDLLRWGAAYAGVGVAIEVAGSGPYTVTLDRSTNAIVAGSGSSVIRPPSPEGVHLYTHAVKALVAAVPQSEKSKLVAAGQQPLQIVAMGGSIGQNRRVKTAANQLCLTTDVRRKLGRVSALDVRPAYANWARVSGVETAMGNTATIQASVRYNGQQVQVTFGGQTSTVIADGEPLLIADPVPASAFGLAEFPAGAELIFRTRWLLAATGHAIPGQWRSNLVAADKVIQDDGSTNQVMTNADLVGADLGDFGPAPVAILGVLTAPLRAVLICADSIGRFDGGGEAMNTQWGDGQTGGGWVNRALFAAGIPYASIAQGSTRASQVAASCAKAKAIYAYADRFLNAYGTNDISAAAAGLTYQQQADAILPSILQNHADAKSVIGPRGVPLATTQVRIFARTTGDYSTEAGQAIADRYADTQTRGIINAALVAGGNIDQVVTLSGIFSVDGQKYAAGMTADGIHPTAVAAAALATSAEVQALVAAWA